uniref:FAD dependent oxidoreductase domain-containing protein n=1 Tax=Amphora coffeiformis TaxID=265554 RepID=A0A7S3L4Q1_9STRA|eukprot:scaffold8602_cov196-Amphora_coffeaeformis.AAC.9
MGEEDTVAQVHPKRLCEHLWEACQKGGCQLIQGKVTGAISDEKGNLQGVQLQDVDGSTRQKLDADALLYACGPWSANIMYGIKGHSLVLPTKRQLKQCVFFYSETLGDCEVFVRPDSTAFCSGFPDDMIKVTEFPGQEEVEPEKANRLCEAVRRCSDQMEDNSSSGKVLGEPALQQACYQPVTDDFLPVMGELNRRASGGCREGSCYMAGGNNCWGILLGPATGECMADLIATGKTPHVDISKFCPSRYRNLKPVVD